MNFYFITGTSRGLGKAIAEELLKYENTSVIGIARTQTIHHDRYEHHELDLSDIDACLEYEFEYHDLADRIVLINNAGTLGDIRHMGEIASQYLVDGLKINLIAPAVLMNRFMMTFRRNPCEKTVVNVSSGAASKPYDGWGMYCASKAGLKMLSEVAAKEQQLDRITYPFTVLSIAPGVVRTAMQDQIRESDKNDFSLIDKFIKLDEEDALYAPEAVAKKYIEIINDPTSVEGVSHRIEL